MYIKEQKKKVHSGFVDSIIGSVTTDQVARYGGASAEYGNSTPFWARECQKCSSQKKF